MAKVEEVAAAIVFLAGPDAGYITGSVLDVNGGYVA
ncbi:SDR family oxidoreductase [Paraburkholderia sp. BL6669N2]|nr:SDR family oxidoreductase [Paraburkholderia sp. BL6669N2]